MGLDTSPKAFLQAFVDKYAGGGGDDASTNAVKLAKDIQDKGVDKWSNFEIEIGKYASEFGAGQARRYDPN